LVETLPETMTSTTCWRALDRQI